MKRIVTYLCVCIVFESGEAYGYENQTGDAASQQLTDFRRGHRVPIGLLTNTAGEPIDIRDTVTLNSELFGSQWHFEKSSHLNRERVPERIVHAKGVGAFGYFEVTNDVSLYTKADVFNGVGKKTPVVGRFSIAIQNLGGTDLSRETKALALKFYTQEGNLDLLCINFPIFLFKDPSQFRPFVHGFGRNPQTRLFDTTMRWDILTLLPDTLHTALYLMSDLALPDGYRKMNIFPIHTYELYNKKGERFFVRFNFRTELGLFNFTTAEAAAVAVDDLDYYVRDLYNAIAEKNYPSWRLEMEILTKEDLKTIDYDPFDVTRLWRRGTYHTASIGRLVFNRHVDNNFKDIEQAAFNPGALVPGILGSPDILFKARKIFYPDTQNYRLGVNHNNIRVNMPLYDKTYTRDGVAPVQDNMRDAPNYYPNSFNGPMPYVDAGRPTDRLVLLQRAAVDLQPMAEFYNEIIESDAHRQRIVTNIASSLVTVPLDLEKQALRMLTLIDVDLGRRVEIALRKARAESQNAENRRRRLAQCIEMA